MTKLRAGLLLFIAGALLHPALPVEASSLEKPHTGICQYDGRDLPCIDVQEFVASKSDDCAIPRPDILCLLDGRFAVQVLWATPDQSGTGQAIPVVAGGGAFWFFGATNPEMLVKIVPACVPPFNAYWVFVAPMTDVQFSLVVKDNRTSSGRVYFHQMGSPAPPIQDTVGFRTCP